jgi:hypothetical protein
MKKSILISVVTLSTIVLFSCHKSDIVVTPTPAPAVEKATATDWMSIQFSGVNNDDGTFSLEGDHFLDGISAADLSGHQALVYARIEQDDQVSFKLLPAALVTTDGNLEINYRIDIFTLSVSIRNSELSDQQIDAAQFDLTKFKVILVPSVDYASMQVDWSNYEEVVAALHLFN